jgi:hypothetical protein
MMVAYPLRAAREAVPIRYKIIEAKRLVVALPTGSVTLDDLMKHLDELARDPRYASPMKKLIDYRNTPMVALTPDEARVLADRKSALQAKFAGERAAVITTRDVDFGMSRVHGVLVEPANIQTAVFRDLPGALAWLEVSLDEGDLTVP